MVPSLSQTAHASYSVGGSSSFSSNTTLLGGVGGGASSFRFTYKATQVKRPSVDREATNMEIRHTDCGLSERSTIAEILFNTGTSTGLVSTTNRQR